jgi:hypothetical protein
MAAPAGSPAGCQGYGPTQRGPSPRDQGPFACCRTVIPASSGARFEVNKRWAGYQAHGPIVLPGWSALFALADRWRDAFAVDETSA